MSMFLTPEEHVANPPSGWVVVKRGRRWALESKSGSVIDTFDTKKQAEAGRTYGMYFNLYQKEGRWFKGEPVDTWKPYVQKS